MEMMAVSVIVLMMTLLAVPAFRGFYRKTQEESAAGHLTRLLRYAHQKSIYKSEEIAVFIDLDKKRFWVRIPEDDDDWRSEEKKELESTLPREFKIERVFYPETEEEVEKKQAKILFYPDGTAQEARVKIVRRDNMEDEERTIVVSVRPNTGRIVTRVVKEEDEYEADAWY